MSEYESLGHMTKSEEVSNLSFYIPHHPVIRESSLSTKLRVVFDASMKSDSSISLNQTNGWTCSTKLSFFYCYEIL